MNAKLKIIDVEEMDLAEIWSQVGDEWSGPSSDVYTWTKERKDAFLEVIRTKFKNLTVKGVQITDRGRGQLKGIILTCKK